MILLDSDILLIDARYKNDSRYPVNLQCLTALDASGLAIGIAMQALLEVVGVLSFNVSPSDVAQLPANIVNQHKLTILPQFEPHANYAACIVMEIVQQMTRQMALGDAVEAVQISLYASSADCLLTWNAKHFVGKMVVPVLTPQDWLDQQSANSL